MTASNGSCHGRVNRTAEFDRGTDDDMGCFYEYFGPFMVIAGKVSDAKLLSNIDLAMDAGIHDACEIGRPTVR
jgi:hypothetical protein